MNKAERLQLLEAVRVARAALEKVSAVKRK